MIELAGIATLVIGSVMSLWNGIVLFTLNRRAKKDDDRDAQLKNMKERIQALEGQRITVEQIREVIKSELDSFELRMIKAGQIDCGGK
ncbi:MAG TPA: hypothetical protein PL124_09685 [Candidatus Cloacimonadota bacterium]|nr:hypothetical protein [Candidatus Cloacimonadota bacterium]HPS39670.1 hypothetical protein [Candidatus Cloacimonadota bacterium]